MIRMCPVSCVIIGVAISASRHNHAALVIIKGRHSLSHAMLKPTLVKQVFEARYERGYRYLDRCGEAMLILEEALPNDTGKAWMPEDIAPAGAKLKCPELDVSVTFDSHHLVVDSEQSEGDVVLAAISKLILAVISARFDLRTFVRWGHRRFLLFPTDAIEDAQRLSIKLAPFENWPKADAGSFRLTAVDTASVYETEDGTEGFRCAMKPSWRAEAPVQLDPRLLQSPRLLPTGQREALIEQMRRQTQREKDPIAGLLLDLDYYWIRPSNPETEPFFKRAAERFGLLAESVAKGS
jgi:hypothetical protein